MSILLLWTTLLLIVPAKVLWDAYEDWRFGTSQVDQGALLFGTTEAASVSDLDRPERLGGTLLGAKAA